MGYVNSWLSCTQKQHHCFSIMHCQNKSWTFSLLSHLFRVWFQSKTLSDKSVLEYYTKRIKNTYWALNHHSKKMKNNDPFYTPKLPDKIKVWPDGHYATVLKRVVIQCLVLTISMRKKWSTLSSNSFRGKVC